MPAGGLFSTAEDVARFCQMVLNGGLAHGKRYLSEEAVQQMTSKQTGNEIKDGYGFGWSVGNGLFGHGGAFATNMTVDRNRGLILIYMVQHSGFPKDGAKAFDLFKEVAIEEFGGAAGN
jgi:CubicO group peptidase (beta-lactamase class C family)